MVALHLNVQNYERRVNDCQRRAEPEVWARRAPYWENLAEYTARLAYDYGGLVRGTGHARSTVEPSRIVIAVLSLHPAVSR